MPNKRAKAGILHGALSFFFYLFSFRLLKTQTYITVYIFFPIARDILTKVGRHAVFSKTNI